MPEPMRQVAPRARVLAHAGLALSAVLALLALLALSSPAQALGEGVEVFPQHVLEGQVFHANLTAPGLAEPQGLQARVECAACGAGWLSPVLSDWKATTPGQWRKTIDFPGPLFGGSNGEPRWGQNYTVSLVGTAAKGNATVHVVDDWLQPDGVYEVTDPVRFRLSGLAAGQNAYINISKWAKSGSLNTVASLRVASVNGVADTEWRIPKEHAADMGCPLVAKCRDYHARITVAGRTEQVGFKALPATLEAKVRYLIDESLDAPVLPLGEGTLTFNRTQNVTISVEAKYHNNARLTGADMTVVGNKTLNGTLQLSVERVTVAQSPGGGNQSQTLLERVALLYATPTPQGWRASWNVPRNLTITQQGADNPQYRVRLLSQEDRFGNDVPDVNGTAFKVDLLRIAPKLLGVPSPIVERLTNASAVYNIRYADGSPWTNSSNETVMRASLVDEQGDTIQSAALRHVGHGTWSMTYQPSLKFKPLGYYKLRIHENNDDANNVLQQTDTEYFEVVPAKPRVELVTKVGHEVRNATQGFARGEFVGITAAIKYADGTPYNTSRLPDGLTYIPLNISKVDERGEVRGWDLLALEATDDDGHWAARYGIPELDERAPLGAWAWNLLVEDLEKPSNANDTVFLRPVRGAGLHVDLLRPPEPLARAGDAITVRYQVRYPAPNGTLLDEARAAGGLAVEVRRWADGKAGDLAARLRPTFIEERGEWTAVWHTNRTTQVGDYVMVLQGQDAFGNLLQPFTTSRIDIFVDRLQRQVLREPSEEVHRGESALVVFDGAEGDIGEEGIAAPRVELQKWNPLRQAWEKERNDLRAAGMGNESGDHVGRFETDAATNLGTYRFALFARNDQHAVVNAQSRAFKLLPLEVERAWLPTALDATAQPIVKGAKLSLALQREDGDQVTSVGLYRNGERVGNATSLLKAGRFEVQWTTAYTLPDGAYQLLVRGRDLHNNSFATPLLAVNLTGVELVARVPAPPAAAIERAERLELRALLQYPDQVHVKKGQFTATFLRGEETVGVRDLVLNRSAWVLNWTPPASAPLGEYRVVVRGDDDLGNKVQAQEVYSFQLAEGKLERKFLFQRNVANRTENVVWVLPADGDDTSMTFILRDETGARREMAFNVSKAGDYVVQWRPAKNERLTRFTLEAHGADAAGNAILAESRGLVLRPAQIGVSIFEQPAREGLKPGQTGMWTFQLQYADGTPIPPDTSTLPRVAITLAGKLVEELKPGIAPDNPNHWVVYWTPGEKHKGVYSFSVGGQDDLGNIIQFQSKTVKVGSGDIVTQLLNVPGPEAALLPLALAGVALAMRRRRGGA